MRPLYNFDSTMSDEIRECYLRTCEQFLTFSARTSAFLVLVAVLDCAVVATRLMKHVSDCIAGWTGIDSLEERLESMLVKMEKEHAAGTLLHAAHIASGASASGGGSVVIGSAKRGQVPSDRMDTDEPEGSSKRPGGAKTLREKVERLSLDSAPESPSTAGPAVAKKKVRGTRALKAEGVVKA